MMYEPKTGKSKMTESCQEHLDLMAKGWGHDKPKKKSMVKKVKKSSY